MCGFTPTVGSNPTTTAIGKPPVLTGMPVRPGVCAGAIVASRLERLVFGAFDEKAGAVGSLWDVVRDRRLNHRPEVVSGVLADESSALLLDFFAAHRG